MFEYELSPLDKESCKWVHDQLKEDYRNWYRAVVEEVELGKDIFTIRTLMLERTNNYELARFCATTARWLYREKEINRQADESYREPDKPVADPPRRRRRGRR